MSRERRFWCVLVEECWRVFWRVLAVLAVSAAVPVGVLIGLRIIGAIVPKVTP